MSQPPSHPPGKSGKLASRLARQVEGEIIASGWPLGKVLGSEAELLERYGVSRAVLREAVRLLEQDHVATMRRGPGGGLVVTEPDTAAVVKATALNLSYNRADAAQVFEVRVALEVLAVRLATERLTEEGVEELRDALQREADGHELGRGIGAQDVHLVIARLSGNPALSLFVDVMADVTRAIAPELQLDETPTVSAEMRQAHELLVQAIISGDAPLAGHRMLRHLRGIRDYLTC